MIREKGLEKVTVDMLVTEITPKARCKFILLSIGRAKKPTEIA